MSSGDVVIVTGASSGIGAAVARRLAAEGYRLILNARSPDRLAEMIAELGSDRASAVAGDIAEPAAAEALLGEALERFGRCDVLVNSAGLIEVGSIAEIDVDRVCRMVRTNIEGTFRISYLVLKHFASIGAGSLINISSVLGTKVRPTAGAYAASKFAVEALSEALRMELARTDIRVCCIEPGLVLTNLHADWPRHPMEAMGIDQPLLPEDVAEMVSFVLSQPARIRIPRLMLLPKGHEI